ncbi:MAG: YidC/Oxa1 family membrane protein insertase [Clostridia bacterium]|nr:YidC/Oxa1 family membrane protein insertase [Clostridia bacterium]
MLAGIGDKLVGIKDFMLLKNGEEVFARMDNIVMPKFTLGSLNLGEVPSLNNPSILWLVPVLTFVTYFFSMRLTKKFTYQPTNAAGGDDRQVACSNWMMDITMPAMSTWIAFIVPALVGIYWIFKSVISTLSRFILSRVMPYPTFTEEDYRAAEREYAGKAPKKQVPGQYSYGRDTKMVGGKPKSLFHMDDDDYVAKIEAEEKKEAEDKAASEIKPAADKRLDGAALKDDDRPATKKKKDDQ